MKTRNDLTYKHMVLIALSIELVLIAIQLIYLQVYFKSTTVDQPEITSEYMKTRGFYIFQIIGFFIYTFTVFTLSRKLNEKILNKILVLILAGGIFELSFYLLMRANYEGAFLYSILDKFIGSTFGLILGHYTAKKAKMPDQYV